MTLHDIIVSDARTVFSDVNDFAEVVVYCKRDGDRRSINANVFRDTLGVFSEDGDTVIPLFEVHVENDSTYGISSYELNRGGDFIEFSVRLGQSATIRAITRLIGHDEGMLVLECR